MKIGACDICNAQDVELSRSEMAGMETWSCSEGCQPFSPVCRANEPFVRNLRKKIAHYRPGEMVSYSALERDILSASLDLMMWKLEKEKA